MDDQRIALTWGDAGENHVGMEIIGNLQETGTGFGFDDLEAIDEYLMENGNYQTEFVDLSYNGSDEPAGVLIIREFVEEDELKKLFNELNECEWDKKFYDTRRKKVLNKRLRYNLMFQHGVSQDADYEGSRGTIVDIDSLPILTQVENRLFKVLKDAMESSTCETEWVDLICEGNNYYDATKCGIGFHGDTERTRVICLSVGGKDYPMTWQWYKNSKTVGEPFNVKLNGGDIYIMSEKAVGQDWKKRSLFTLRHAAGSKAFSS